MSLAASSMPTSVSPQEAIARGQAAGGAYRLAAPLRPPVGQLGEQVGRRAGGSLEFMDHRAYEPGDDLRRIDWSAYARSDRLTIKRYTEEVSPHLDIVLDTSRSMHLEETPKAAAALGLCALLATAAKRARQTHRLWLAGSRIDPASNGDKDPHAWPIPQAKGNQNLAQAWQCSTPRFRPYATRIVVSDLLFETDPTALLRNLGRGANRLILLRLLSTQDITPPARGNLRLLDAETGETMEVYFDANAQAEYEQRLEDNRALWHRSASALGVTLVDLTDAVVDRYQVPELVRAEVLQAQ